MSMKIECLKALGGAGLVALLAGSAIAEPNKAEEIAQLEAKLQQARAEYAQQLRQEQLNQLTAAAASDAASRSFFMGGPATVGYNGPGKGFGISDQTGNNTLNISAYSQFRYIMNFQNDFDGFPNVDGTSTGFEFAQNRICLKGKLLGELDYTILGGFAASGGGFTLLDAYFDWNFEQDMTLRVGQMPAPFSWEFFGIATTGLLAVERSTVDAIFGAHRSTGIALIYTGIENLTLVGSLNDGLNAGGTDWNDDRVEYALTARADYVFAGDPAQFRDFTSDLSSDFGFRLGGAVHWQEGDVGDGATPGSGLKDEPNTFTWTVDAQAEFQGANLYAAVFGHHIHDRDADNSDHYGYFVQGGFYFTDDMELFARWEHFSIDDYDLDEPHIITVGLNYYLNGHVNKLTADVGFATEEMTPIFARDSRGTEVDAPGKDGQVFIRFQWQLMI